MSLPTSNTAGFLHCITGGYARPSSGGAQNCDCNCFRQARFCTDGDCTAGGLADVWMTCADAETTFGRAFRLTPSPSQCYRFCTEDPTSTTHGPLYAQANLFLFPDCTSCDNACYLQARDCSDDSFVDIWMTCADAIIASGGVGKNNAFHMISGPFGCYYFKAGDATTVIPGGTLYTFSDALSTGDVCDNCSPVPETCEGNEPPSDHCEGPYTSAVGPDFYIATPAAGGAVCDLSIIVCDCETDTDFPPSAAVYGMPQFGLTRNFAGSFFVPGFVYVGHVTVDNPPDGCFCSLDVYTDPGAVFIGSYQLSQFNPSLPGQTPLLLSKTTTGASGTVICGTASYFSASDPGVGKYCVFTATVTIRQRCCNDAPP